MALLIADESLGIKHKKINTLVNEAIKNKMSVEDPPLPKSHQDISNLIKIDIASYNKDIDYILDVLKSEDFLYISRAIKKGIWLVDDQYAHIINPQYLCNHLFPYMKTKAIIKLTKHIRHYLKSESRAEQFYLNENNSESAAKWLSRCSVPFIEANISKHLQSMTDVEFKRLCERSVTVFEAAVKDDGITKTQLKAASFLLHSNAEKYLDVFEKNRRYTRPYFGPRATDIIMKKARDRVINNFLIYSENIHVPTFLKHIKREDIKDFLFKLACKEVNDMDEDLYSRIFSFSMMTYFVRRMPKEEQFEFVKKVFLDKENLDKINDNSIERNTEIYAMKRICLTVWPSTSPYFWYEFAPFSIAFNEIKQFIQIEDNKNQKNSMLNVLLKCAGTNTEDLFQLMTYYSKLSLNDSISQKKTFTNNFFAKSEMYKFNEDTWNTFEQVFTKLNINNDKDYQEYNDIVILNQILNGKKVPEATGNNLLGIGLQRYRKNLNLEEQNKVFDYLYGVITKIIHDHQIQNEQDFTEAVRLLHQLLNLLLDWDKQLIDYEFPLVKIKDLIRIKIDNSWSIDISSLYNKKKSWKLVMFEESVILNPSQSTCLNALKHDPGLLVRYKDNVNSISCNDKISLQQFLKKLRIYWPETLAVYWRCSYIDELNKSGNYEALTRGLCTLLHKDLLLDVVQRYAPVQPKVDWNNIDEVTLSLQRNIAKHMHIARPQPSADVILMYAKGDFLQYALPSLHAIFYNMDNIQSQSQVPKLFNAPVSLQKHGVRFAFKKLSHIALKENLLSIWQTSKNTSIRAVIFGLLFDLMCNEKDGDKVKELWDIFEVFIDSLTFKEDKKIYEKLTHVHKVPEKIKPKFLIKSYKFLESFLPHSKEDRATFENAVRDLATCTTELMEFMSPVFITGIITEYFDVDFFNGDKEKNNNRMLNVTSAYLLCAKDEETQMSKYENNLAPIINRALEKWNEKGKNNDVYFVRDQFQDLLKCLYCDLSEYSFKNNMIIPIKMFTQIQKQLEKSLDVSQNYTMLTMWKLVVKLTDLIDKTSNRENWHQAFSDVAPEFGRFCLEVLKQDVSLYFPFIYILFTKALGKVLREIVSDFDKLQIYEVLLTERDFIQPFLVTLKFLNILSDLFCFDDDSDDDECIKKAKEIRTIIREHPSVEVKMHYYNTFNDEGYQV